MNDFLTPDLLSDPRIRDHMVSRAIEFIDVVIDSAIEGLEEGDPSTQRSIMRAILPQLLKSTVEDDQVGATEIYEQTRKLFEAESHDLLTASGINIDDDELEDDDEPDRTYDFDDMKKSL